MIFLYAMIHFPFLWHNNINITLDMFEKQFYRAFVVRRSRHNCVLSEQPIKSLN